ncbi:MAG: hypothetical protein WDZ61_00270 [Parcubacteria group bacterium]
MLYLRKRCKPTEPPQGGEMITFTLIMGVSSAFVAGGAVNQGQYGLGVVFSLFAVGIFITGSAYVIADAIKGKK